MSRPDGPDADLAHALGPWDAALVTVGAVLGTGIFITTGDMARVLPHTGLLLAAWVLGGLLSLAGALTYAELGGMYPRAGGQYHFLKEAYGPLPGFLFGWAAFFVIMTGGIAALAVGFGEYLGAFVPFFSTANVLVRIPGWEWTLSGGQVAGTLVIVLLTGVNYVGLTAGVGLQNFVTVVKIGSIVGLGLIGLWVPATATPHLLAHAPAGGVAAFGVAMIAVLWSYDGWYAVTNLAGEMRRPSRDLPLGLVGGTTMVMALYVLMNLAYFRALPVEAMGDTGRVGETAATALFGPLGGQLITTAVLISTFGCISSTILYAARIYLPMAADGLFFPALARVHPRYLTPAACLVAQGVWSVLLTCSGTYDQLYTYVVFAVVLFHTATGAAVFVLRRTRPLAERPYRAWGYPWVSGLFVASSGLLALNTARERPVESAIGLGLLALGIPAYTYWRRASARG